MAQPPISTQIDLIAEAIAREIKLKVQQELSGFSLFDETPPTPSKKKKSTRNRPGPKAVGRSLEDLDAVDQKILTLLAAEPTSVQQLSKKVKIALSAVYKRVGRLKDERRLKLVKDGNRVMYTVVPRLMKVTASKPKTAGKS